VQKAYEKAWHDRHIVPDGGHSFSLLQQIFAAPWKVPIALVGSICDNICDKIRCCSVGEIEQGKHGRACKWYSAETV
jgi:hypothetical protein